MNKDTSLRFILLWLRNEYLVTKAQLLPTIYAWISCCALYFQSNYNGYCTWFLEINNIEIPVNCR